MKKVTIVLAILLFLFMFFATQAQAQDVSVKQAVTQAALDYIDGAHASDAARMERAVHPELLILSSSAPLESKIVLSPARYLGMGIQR